MARSETVLSYIESKTEIKSVLSQYIEMRKIETIESESKSIH